MDITKAVAASIRGMGLKPKAKRAGVDPMPPPIPLTLSPEELRAQRANLRLLESTKATLTRTIGLLK